MSFVEWLWRLVSNIGFIVRKGHSHGKFRVLKTYLRIEVKRFFIAGLFKRKLTSEKIFGFRVHFYSYETFAVLFEEVYVPDVYFFSSSSTSPFILDCGSNIGLAVFYFKGLYPESKIVAFEPDASTFEILRRNIETNRLQNVSLVNKALYDSKGVITFYISPDHPGLLVQSIRKESLPNASASSVETDMLSEYIDREVDFLKMDIEGAEDRVMRDLEDSEKLRFIKEMVIEYHHHITPSEDRLGEFLRIMESDNMGYLLKAPADTPFRRGEFQGMLIFGYRQGH